MANCPYCGEKLSYKRLLPISWKSRTGVECPNCHQTSYNSADMRKKSTLIVLIIPLLLIIKDLFNIAFPFMYGIFFMLIVGFILALPLFVKLTKKEEPLW
ncbi:TIGR04104 family putative zinc finger protein [Piscibacillus salipiscarius]|uniref:TIGR04104 family putative zinc finger protein n=1 Tax=Piscibacillus salipiscarius TaxID=299480 RepID=A0ABW5Q6B8_9BACI